MATRNPKNVSTLNTTEFQLHASHRTIFVGIMHKIIDYGEYKLARYAETVSDPQQRAVLLKLINDYKRGNVAIAWKRGQPVWLPVTKDV